ncbi:hypothetical protein BGZ60DRAFT_397077 [Tricladium varicosporioides]|nr:hypothetical protein BGZ60DRAFT_397077 [Hymenoscyphus varicosporioides]
MARVVYQGVGGGGDLFEGTKFFLLQRIPLRNQWKEQIEANGGEVVKLEKWADIIIADHAQKTSPTGSISWTYIQDSVKNGKLEALEDHRAGPIIGTVREVGSAQPVRSGRTLFTHEDDKFLMEWVSRAERKGALIKGNDLYKQLEQKNPRHTFQSWRDRWIKYVQHRPRPSLTDEDAEEEDAPPQPLPRPATSSHRTVSPPQPQTYEYEIDEEGEEVEGSSTAKLPAHMKSEPLLRSTTSKHSSRTTGPSSVSPTPEIKSAKRARIAQNKAIRNVPAFKPTTSSPSATQNSAFTEDEIQMLLDNYDDIMNVSDDMTIDAWLQCALEYPTHSAQEWYNFFKKKIIPMRTATTQKDGEPNLTTITEPNHPSEEIITPEKSIKEKKTAEIKDSQGSSGRTVSSQNHDNGVEDPTIVDEKRFEEDLMDFATELGVEVNFHPTICGRRISLHRLWCVVRSSEPGGYDQITGQKLWGKVAKELNFNEFRHPKAAQELQSCYGEILADFEGLLEEYLQEPELTESQENALLQDQLRQTTAQGQGNLEAEPEEDDDDDLNQPPSSSAQPTPTSSSKRSFEVGFPNTGSSYNKRQRIDKGKGKEGEIPSTPEDVINRTATSQHIPESSPLKSFYRPEDLEVIEDEGGVAVRPMAQPDFGLSPELPTRPRLEPETQDFHFAGPNDGSDFVDLTSSPERVIPLHHTSSTPTTPKSIHQSLPEDSSTQSMTESQKGQEVDDFLNRWVGLGYEEDLAFQALEVCSMETGNAGEVLESLTVGRGIPDDIEGVWTTADDEALNARNESSKYKRILKKHGPKRIETRRQYLREMAESDDAE